MTTLYRRHDDSGQSRRGHRIRSSLAVPVDRPRAVRKSPNGRLTTSLSRASRGLSGRAERRTRKRSSFLAMCSLTLNSVIAMKIKPQPFKRDVARHRPARLVPLMSVACPFPNSQSSSFSHLSHLSHLLSVFSHLKLPFNSYGVRPSETYTLEDQLGLVPGTKSKIEDGSETGTSGGEVVTVADFR